MSHTYRYHYVSTTIMFLVCFGGANSFLGGLISEAAQEQQIWLKNCTQIIGETKMMETTKCMDGISRKIAPEMVQAISSSNFESVCRIVKDEGLKCLVEVAKNLNVCMNADHIMSVELHNLITSNAIDFLCFERGKRINSFIKDGGPTCIQSQKFNIENCVGNIPGLKSLALHHAHKSLQDGCTLFDSVRKCFVKHAKTCENSSAAELIDSLVSSAFEGTVCSSKPVTSQLLVISEPSSEVRECDGVEDRLERVECSMEEMRREMKEMKKWKEDDLPDEIKEQVLAEIKTLFLNVGELLHTEK